MISTGRGGAGNMVLPSDIPKKASPPAEHKHDHKKIYYSTGRGGAGNIKSSDEIPSPKLVPQGSNTPALTTLKFTTGRGGYGNMVSNDDPELARKLQDVDGNKPSESELQAVTSNKSFSVGRGGFGNVISNTRSHGSSTGSGSNNLYAVVSHGEKKKKQSDKKGLINKVKSIFS
ncbi:CIC11C00000001968 [Sungouiella intermedia]|uniref:CIC11C00000000184 n=1 Tax=Sungouiella intermedia TaxID=45354 RepID=A0A1L0BKJ1_9ASCO|nr:CIC11C00000001968 [[Candida] intermedia]SGZ50714.1 CIC11C00000000184 [[Candida] intermedia]